MSSAFRLVDERDAKCEAIRAAPWSGTVSAPFDAAAHRDVLQLGAPRGDHLAQRVMEVEPATLTEGIVAVEPRDVSQRLPLGVLPPALSLFQHLDHELFDLRIQLFKRSLPAQSLLPSMLPFIAVRPRRRRRVRPWGTRT